jgi:hypothetical protein
MNSLARIDFGPWAWAVVAVFPTTQAKIDPAAANPPTNSSDASPQSMLAPAFAGVPQSPMAPIVVLSLPYAPHLVDLHANNHAHSGFE